MRAQKGADDQHEVSATFAMRLEDLCERGARILQFDIMGASPGRLSVSDRTCYALTFGVMARDAKVLNSTKDSQSPMQINSITQDSRGLKPRPTNKTEEEDRRPSSRCT